MRVLFKLSKRQPLCAALAMRNNDDRIRTSQITTQHEIENKEAVFVVLEGKTQIDNEGMVDLLREGEVEANA